VAAGSRLPWPGFHHRVRTLGREINAINDASARTLLTALATHIRDGVAAGDMADVDPEAAAQFLLAVRSGLKVAARSGADLKALRAIARMALRSLRA
jgi:hypothetical protein